MKIINIIEVLGKGKDRKCDKQIGNFLFIPLCISFLRIKIHHGILDTNQYVKQLNPRYSKVDDSFYKDPVINFF